MRNTPKRAHKQAPRKSSHIPKPDAAGGLAIYDGTCFAGGVIERDGIFYAFASAGGRIGQCHTLREAVRSLPCADLSIVSVKTQRRRAA
jgi:hypothetical protein